MPRFKKAGRFWGTFLKSLGFHGVYTPWGIFLAPRYYNNQVLRRHELAHWQQRVRDGFILFWLKTFWYLLRYGYWNSPYEVEARRVAQDAH